MFGAYAALHAEQRANDVAAEFVRCHGEPIEGASAWLDEKYSSFASTTLRQAYFGWEAKEPSLDGTDWRPVPSMLDAHREIYSRAGMPFELGGRQVFIFMVSNHWTAIARSIVATRAEDGLWRVKSIQAINDRMPELEYFDTRQVALSRSDSAIVDAILADPCFAIEPSRSNLSYVSSSEGESWTLETAGFGADRPLMRSHSGFGRTAMLYDLLQR